MDHESAKISPEGLEMISQIEREQVAQGIDAEGQFPERYKLAFGSTVEELNHAVDRLMAAGWFPHGSPITSVDYAATPTGEWSEYIEPIAYVVFGQAMVRS